MKQVLDVFFEVGVDSSGIGGEHLDPRVVEAPRERLALHQEFDLEAREQDLVERANDQLILTNGQNAHVSPCIRWSRKHRVCGA